MDLYSAYENCLRGWQRQSDRASDLRAAITSYSRDLQLAEQSIALEQDTLRLLQLTSSAVWDTTKQTVENLVTRALQAVFYDKDYKFVVRQEVKRGATSVEFGVLDSGLELSLVDDLGGGVADVVSLALRISLLMLYRPATRPILVLDEPLKHLWEGYQSHAGRFLRQVAEELKIHILVTTHQRELADQAGQVFIVKKPGSVCHVETHEQKH